jgi:hypothetical protein
VVAVSREFERLSGWRAAEVRGLPLAELLQGGAAAPETLHSIRGAAATYELVAVACVHARWARKREGVVQGAVRLLLPHARGLA